MLTEFLQLGFLISIFAGAVRMGTIILLAALGELVTERSGVLNLSVEGMMLSGALAGFLGLFIPVLSGLAFFARRWQASWSPSSSVCWRLFFKSIRP